jgi:hypothetical protein
MARFTADIGAFHQRLALPHAPVHIDVGRLAQRHPQRILQSSYPSASERDLAVVRFARMAGRPPADAWSLMSSVRADGKGSPLDYAIRAIGRIYQ